MTSPANPFDHHVAANWPAIIRTRANILVSGDRARLNDFLTTCTRECAEPVARQYADAPMAFSGCRTLVLVDVDALPAAAQEALKQWLDAETSRGTQVVSLTSVALFDAVRDGRFDSELFYRLNTIHLRLV